MVIHEFPPGATKNEWKMSTYSFLFVFVLLFITSLNVCLWQRWTNWFNISFLRLLFRQCPYPILSRRPTDRPTEWKMNCCCSVEYQNSKNAFSTIKRPRNQELFHIYSHRKKNRIRPKKCIDTTLLATYRVTAVPAVCLFL